MPLKIKYTFLIIQLFVFSCLGDKTKDGTPSKPVYDCAYIEKHCDQRDFVSGEEDFWEEFYCGDHTLAMELNFSPQLKLSFSTGKTLLNDKQIGELGMYHEITGYQIDGHILIEANSHFEVGSTGTLYLIDIKKEKLFEIGDNPAAMRPKTIMHGEDYLYTKGQYRCEHDFSIGMIDLKKKTMTLVKKKNAEECKAFLPPSSTQLKAVSSESVQRKDESGFAIPTKIPFNQIKCEKIQKLINPY